MFTDDPLGPDALREALGPRRNCMPIESLERCVDPHSVPPELARHLESCSCCRADLDLLRSFLRGPNDDEADAVNTITKQLRVPGIRRDATSRPWWVLLQVRWLSPAAIAMAGVLIVVAVGLQWRHATPPRLNVPNREDAEILRSGSISVVDPVGDLREVPSRIQWQPAPGAERYRVRLLEVDHSELWTTATTESEIGIPPAVQSKIVPAKTLLVQVSAFDSSDRKLAESDFVRFRLLQKVYSH